MEQQPSRSQTCRQTPCTQTCPSWLKLLPKKLQQISPPPQLKDETLAFDCPTGQSVRALLLQSCSPIAAAQMV